MATEVSRLGATAETLSEKTKSCVERLLRAEYEIERPDLCVLISFRPLLDLYDDGNRSNQPKEKLAAVLVLLFEQAGELRVILTTRSKLLRTHPGQTALPGGKVDESDPSLIDTAFREAHEEVGLPLDCTHVHKLCVLQPFLSASGLLVTPVVALLTDVGLLADLTPCVGEVDRIFSHSLEAILDPHLAGNEPLVAKGSEHWPYSQDFHSMSDVVVEADTSAVYRMHRFRSCASPIKGLTADILIRVAELAYHKKTSYERHPLGHAGLHMG
ncbi:NUDIX hydrolase domain-like protein [Pisolithus marmoratus]|nr:NUDIX hydrolase domain-like protein [Pisolithus marmoratus]